MKPKSSNIEKYIPLRYEIIEDDHEYFQYEIDNIVYRNKVRHNQKFKSKKMGKYKEIQIENQKLKKENNLLMTLCGFKNDVNIVKYVICIQAAVRGWILRYDKRIFDKSVALCQNACRMFLAKLYLKSIQSSVLQIQRLVRGFLVRQSMIGKALKKISQLKRALLDFDKIYSC